VDWRAGVGCPRLMSASDSNPGDRDRSTPQRVVTGLRAEPTDDAKREAQPLVEVTPAANYQLSHEGTVAGQGETLTVPQELADRWARWPGLIVE